MANRRVDAGGSILLIMQKCHVHWRRIGGERTAGAAQETMGVLQTRHMEGRIRPPCSPSIAAVLRRLFFEKLADRVVGPRALRFGAGPVVGIAEPARGNERRLLDQ